MLDDFILDDLETFEDIDTSDVELDDSDLDTSNFFESFGASENTDFSVYEDFDSFTSDEHLGAMSDDADIAEDGHFHHIEHNNHSHQISFGSLYGRCHDYNCLCKQFEGTYGTVCKNCYHGFDKHY